MSAIFLKSIFTRCFSDFSPQMRQILKDFKLIWVDFRDVSTQITQIFKDFKQCL
jgi:hypothetical protein